MPNSTLVVTRKYFLFQHIFGCNLNEKQHIFHNNIPVKPFRSLQLSNQDGDTIGNPLDKQQRNFTVLRTWPWKKDKTSILVLAIPHKKLSRFFVSSGKRGKTNDCYELTDQSARTSSFISCYKALHY